MSTTIATAAAEETPVSTSAAAADPAERLRTLREQGMSDMQILEALLASPRGSK